MPPRRGHPYDPGVDASHFGRDYPFAASLLLHPTALGVAMHDVDGVVIAANARAGELLTPEMRGALNPVLRAAMAQLQAHPDRTIVHVHEHAGVTLECRLRAVLREGVPIGYT